MSLGATYGLGKHRPKMAKDPNIVNASGSLRANLEPDELSEHVDVRDSPSQDLLTALETLFRGIAQRNKFTTIGDPSSPGQRLKPECFRKSCTGHKMYDAPGCKQIFDNQPLRPCPSMRA